MTRSAFVAGLSGFLVSALSASNAAVAQTGGPPARAIAVLSPTPGSPEYQEIVALVRQPLLRGFGETVQIEVSRINRMGAFGYVVATASSSGGNISEPDWSTAFGACQFTAGQRFVPQVRVLLKSVRGIWQMAEYEVCPPNGEEARWVRKYDTTIRLFGAADRILP